MHLPYLWPRLIIPPKEAPDRMSGASSPLRTTYPSTPLDEIRSRPFVIPTSLTPDTGQLSDASAGRRCQGQQQRPKRPRRWGTPRPEPRSRCGGKKEGRGAVVIGVTECREHVFDPSPKCTNNKKQNRNRVRHPMQDVTKPRRHLTSPRCWGFAYQPP